VTLPSLCSDWVVWVVTLASRPTKPFLLLGRTRGLGTAGEISREKPISRIGFREIIEGSSIHPEFEQYRKYWGALQAQGMLLGMSRGNAGVMQQVQESMSGDLRRVYGEQLDKKRGHWFVLGKDATGKAIQLLRFRGGSDLQAAVWEGSRFTSTIC